MLNEGFESLKRIFKGAGLVIFGLIISKVLGYIYRIIIARTGTESYGLLSIALALFGVIITISLMGLQTGILRYVAYYKSKNDMMRVKSVIFSSLRIALPLSIVLSFIVFIFAGWLAVDVFHNPKLEIIFRIIAISVPFDVLAILLFQINKAFQVVKYEIFIKHILENFVKIISLVLFLVFGILFLGPILSYVLGVIIASILAFIFTHKKVFGFLDKKIKWKSMYKKLFLFSWPLIFTTFLTMFMLWTDTMMLGYFTNASQVGIYNAAGPTAQIMYIVPYAFSFLFIPLLTDFYSKKKHKMFNYLYKSVTRFIFTLNLFFLLIFIVLSSLIIHTLFGINYITAVIPLIILSIGYFINYTNITSNNLIIVLKKTKLLFFDLLLGAFVNILLNFVLIPSYGIVGAAIATAISFSLLGILYIIQAKKLIPSLKLFDASYIKVIIASLFSITGFFLIKHFISFSKTWISLIVNIVIMALLYVSFLFLFGFFNEEDKTIFKLIKNKLQQKIK